MKSGCERVGTGAGIRTGGLTISLALLAACTAHDGTSIPSSGVAPMHREGAEARFTIKVPKKRPRRHKFKRPGFISADTQSLKLTIAPAGGGAAVIAKAVNLTPASPGCADVSGSTLCSFTENLPPGSYVVSVEAYDGLGGAGNLLSAAQRVPFTALAGRANSVALTLSGIPHTLAAVGAEAAVRTFPSGMRLYGAAQQPFTLTAKDSDGEAIVGPGAPQLSVALKSGNGWALATPSPNSPTTAKLTPPNVNGSSASIQVDAAYDDSTCTLASAVCQTSFSITNDIQTMFVSDAYLEKPSITIYTPVSAASPTATISSGLVEPMALGVDSHLDLVVLDSEKILVYAPPYSDAPLHTITLTAATAPYTMSVSPDGHIAVADAAWYGAPHDVEVYAPPYTGSPVTITADYPNGLIFDSNNDLFIASSSSLWGGSPAESVDEYQPPYTGAAVTTITSGISGPGAMVFDQHGDIFVANLLGQSVTEYAPPYNTTATTVSTGMTVPWSVAMNYDGDLFVSNMVTSGPGVGSPATVAKYSPPYSSSPTMIAAGANAAVFPLAVDNANNLYALQNCQCGVTAGPASLLGFASPYTGSAYSIVGFNVPWTVLITP